jgi:hypothetical protein
VNSRRAFAAALFGLALSFTTLPASSAVAETPSTPMRVLFLGNSITYVGNLPAVFAAICQASGHACSVEMIVKGGAALSDRVADRTLERVDVANHFDYLVLQERGGDLIELPDTAAKMSAQRAAEALVKTARRLGMKPILMGTYQPGPASASLVAAESALSAKLHIPHVSVSNYLDCGKREDSSLRWFYSDGMHPGSDLTLMMAVGLHREIFGTYPPAVALDVRAPVYSASSGLTSDKFAGAQALRAGTASSISYDAATVQSVVAVSRGPCPKP